MEIASVPSASLHASPRCMARGHRIARVKFVGLPVATEPGVALRGQRAQGAVARFLSRVIGRLAAARP